MYSDLEVEKKRPVIVALFFGSSSGPQKADRDGAIISDAHPIRLTPSRAAWEGQPTMGQSVRSMTQ